VSEAEVIGTRATAGLEERRRRRRTVALSLLVGAFAVASFPGDFRPIASGLDPSWIYAINRLPHTEFRFGADVVFSYGPLGYLLVPVDIGSNLAQAVVSWIGVQAGTVLIALYHFRRHGRIDSVALFAVGSLGALSLALPYEYRILALLGLCLSVDPEDRTAWRLASVAAAVLAAGLVYAKMTAGVAAVAMVAGAGLIRAWQRTISWRQLAIGLAGFLVILVGLGLLLTGGFSELGRWFRGSWEVASGFAEAMSIPQPSGLLWPGILALVAFLAVLVLIGRVTGGTAAVAVALGVMALLAFRHAYVRHHGRLLYPVLLTALAVMALMVGSRRDLAILLAGSLAVTGFAVAAFLTPGCLCTWRWQALGLEGVRNVVSLTRLPATRAVMHRRTVHELAIDRLPDELLTAVRESPPGGDALPEEISFFPANGVAWVPNPALQTYHAFTPYLDAWTASHFAGPNRPGSLLVEFVDVDGRHPMFAAPRMWRAILSGYDVAGSAKGGFGEVTVLTRVPRHELELHEVGEGTATVGRWHPVPSLSTPTFAEIHLRPDPLGRVAGLVWRIDPVFLDAKFEDGSVATFRFVPRTAPGGLLVSPLPISGAEFRDLVAGDPLRRVDAIRIHGPGTSSFRASVPIVWRAASGMP
jgi:hypothetical protein